MMTGFHGLKFVLPPGLDPQGPPNVERNFHKRYRRYHNRLHRVGTIRGWLQLAEVCRGQSRLVAALCLAFTGPWPALLGVVSRPWFEVEPGLARRDVNHEFGEFSEVNSPGLPILMGPVTSGGVPIIRNNPSTRSST
jgi:hypothetical protein